MSTQISSRPRAYRFGPFTADLPNGELRKEGLRVRLERKPWQVLVALLERPGEIVTRAELEKRLWPDGVFVDFEHGVNVAVKKLRSALLDSVAEPRYVATVPGEGYRFIAEVEEIPMASDLDVARRVAPPEPQPVHADPDAALPPAPARQRAETFSLMAVLLVLVFAAGFGLYWPRAHRGKIPGANMMITRVLPGEQMHVSSGTSISPDGKLVAYQTDEGDKRTIWVRQLATGSAIAVAESTTDNPGTTVFSRDGSFLYYNRRGMIWRVPTLGGTSQKVVGGATGAGCLSPGDRHFAFMRNLSGDRVALYVSDADGSNERLLAARQRPGNWFMFGCAWSPDGSHIAIGGGTTIGQTAYNTVLSVDAANGTTTPLTTKEWNFVGRVNWLADNSGIVFEGSEKGEPSQLYEISLPDGAARRLTTDLAGDYQRWSTVVADDGETAVAIRQVTASHLWVVHPGDPAGKMLKNGTGTDGFGGVASMPDGRIVFSSVATGNYALWIVDPNGKDPARQITRDALTAQFPRATADGRYAVFTGYDNGRYVIFRASVKSGDVRVISSSNNAGHPVVSPDSRNAYFFSSQGFWRTDIESGEAKLISDKSINPLGITPDGKLLVAMVDAPGSGESSLAMLSTETLEVVRTLPGIPIVRNGAIMRLTPDGREITYVDIRDGSENIVSRPLGGGEARQLTRFSGEHIFSFDWTPQGDLIVARGTRTGDAVLIRNLR